MYILHNYCFKYKQTLMQIEPGQFNQAAKQRNVFKSITKSSVVFCSVARGGDVKNSYMLDFKNENSL